MDVKDFCKEIEKELTVWKAKFYDAMRKIETLSSGDREKVLPNIQDINMIVTELEDRIESLKTECPSDWSPQKKEINDAHVNMRSKYEELIEIINKSFSLPISGYPG